MTLNANSYREVLRQKLVESDAGLQQVAPVSSPAKEATYSGVLDSLREKLFGPQNDAQATPTDIPETSVTTVATEDAYQDAPEAIEPIGPHNDEVALTADDLNDLATDTIAEVLNSIKELRDQVKKENPKKAALVRRIYDHLLKGKDKITAEILKSHEEEKTQTVEKPAIQ